MTDDTAIPPAATERVMPVHRCRGRVRLQVHGLYRKPALRRRLETALADVSGVERAAANLATGRLLVLFAAPMTLPRLVAQVDALLGERCMPRPAARLRRYPASRALASFAALLRGLGRFVVAEPSFGALAGTASAAHPRRLEPQPLQAWFAMQLAAVESALSASPETGLAADAAAERLRRYGENALAAAETRSDIAIFVGQFNSLPVGLLGHRRGARRGGDPGCDHHQRRHRLRHRAPGGADHHVAHADRRAHREGAAGRRGRDRAGGADRPRRRAAARPG